MLWAKASRAAARISACCPVSVSAWVGGCGVGDAVAEADHHQSHRQEGVAAKTACRLGLLNRKVIR
jgi:hypothetical protein